MIIDVSTCGFNILSAALLNYPNNGFIKTLPEYEEALAEYSVDPTLGPEINKRDSDMIFWPEDAFLSYANVRGIGLPYNLVVEWWEGDQLTGFAFETDILDKQMYMWITTYTPKDEYE